MYTYQGKNILVLGTGVSGQGVAKVLCDLGANVVVNDNKKLESNSEILKRIKSFGAKVITGLQDESLLEGVDRIVVSPGIPPSIPLLKKAYDLGIAIVSEVEVAYDICKAPILGITGTNGKTTTTMLLGDVVKACGKEVVVGGNIGDSLSEQAYKVSEDGYLVAELSSYQLETVKDFHPRGAIFLNLTPDHLHRHKTMQAYGEAKMNIAKNQNANDFFVLNKDDEFVRNCAKKVSSKILWISQSEKITTDGAYYDGHDIYAVKNGIETKIISRSEINLRGNHNIENVLAVVALTFALGFDFEKIATGIRNFKAVEHRIEPVCKKGGVIFVNDSKATNTDATIKALLSFDEPIVLMLGGHDKGEDLYEFLKLVNKRVKHIIFMGEATGRFVAVAKEVGIESDMFECANSMPEAVEKATKNAVKGDIVLLSPACSSFDWYNSFEERGEDFKKIVTQ